MSLRARIMKALHPTERIGDVRFPVSLVWSEATARFEFKPADCWIGVFWRKERWERHIWICAVPMLPLHITIPRGYEDASDKEEN